MRAAPSILLLSLVACAADREVTDPPATMRERLETATRLEVAATASGAAINAERRTDHGWAARLVDLPLTSGVVVAHADAGSVTIDQLQLAFAPVTIPATLIGHEAQLSELKLWIAAPAVAPAAWHDDDQVSAKIALPLVLSWQLSVDGLALPLGAPALPPLTVDVELTGSGARVAADVHLEAPGELWSWAGLVRLGDFMLVLGAETP